MKVWTVQIQIDRSFEEAYTKPQKDFNPFELVRLDELTQSFVQELEKFGYTRWEVTNEQRLDS